MAESNRATSPSWLKPLLSTTFFTPCSTYPHTLKNECNHYCLDCAGTALCSYCLLNHHNHHIVQIRRSSYHDAIRVSEISKLIDISCVQSYVINSHKIVFLNGRPQARHGKGVTNTCKVCGRSILDPVRFCSLGCKLGGMENDLRLTFKIDGDGDGAARNVTKRLVFDGDGSGSSNSVSPTTSNSISMSSGTPPIVNFRVSKRKGVPRRAPPI